MCKSNCRYFRWQQSSSATFCLTLYLRCILALFSLGCLFPHCLERAVRALSLNGRRALAKPTGFQRVTFIVEFSALSLSRFCLNSQPRNAGWQAFLPALIAKSTVKFARVFEKFKRRSIEEEVSVTLFSSFNNAVAIIVSLVSFCKL